MAAIAGGAASALPARRARGRFRRFNTSTPLPKLQEMARSVHLSWRSTESPDGSAAPFSTAAVSRPQQEEFRE